MTCKLTLGITQAMLHNIDNIILQWGAAAGPFLSIESQMRLLAELHLPLKEKIVDIIKNEKHKPRNKNYWDCNPNYITKAIDIVFANDIQAMERLQLLKFPALRGKFLHGNFIELMNILGIEPTGRDLTKGKRNILTPGEIMESFLSMERNQVFNKLRIYSIEISDLLRNLLKKLAK